MMRVLTLSNVKNIIQQVGIETCFVELVRQLEHDFSRWETFDKTPRVATHFDHGVIELMPISDQEFYAYKYVNGHPNNPQQKKLTVVAVGMLSEVESGYPILFSEMTLLTAIRTAATCALASKYLARNDSTTVGIIGTGSQSEFQVLALKAILGIRTVRYFDIDAEAMQKFEKNLSAFDLKLIPCEAAVSVLERADVIVTATADKQRSLILENHWVQPGVHINGVGGDCPGKTEIDLKLLERAKIVIEYYEQSKHEGEIQHLLDLPHQLYDQPYAELWELITQQKPARESNDEITLFDSVGFALEDYTVLRYFNDLAAAMNIGEQIDILPNIDNPKNLFGLLRNVNRP